MYKVELENATQSTTYVGTTYNYAGNAIDDDMTTTSHTKCGWDIDIWFKLVKLIDFSSNNWNEAAWYAV